MSANETRTKGLTGLILEALLEATPKVIAEGEQWSPEFMDALGQELKAQLAPSDNGSGRRIFDFVFDRSFAEASDAFNRLLSQAQYEAYPGGSLALA